MEIWIKKQNPTCVFDAAGSLDVLFNSKWESKKIKQKVLDYISDPKKVTYDYHSVEGFSCEHFTCNCYPQSKRMEDEKYMWNWSLAHYVTKHKVVLPREFIDHVLSRQA